MPAPMRDEQYSATMKISPTSTSMIRVSGNSMMIVLAALNPGMAPTMRPRKIDGMITHHVESMWTNKSTKNAASISILEHRREQRLDRAPGQPGLEQRDEGGIADAGHDD